MLLHRSLILGGFLEEAEGVGEGEAHQGGVGVGMAAELWQHREDRAPAKAALTSFFKLKFWLLVLRLLNRYQLKNGYMKENSSCYSPPPKHTHTREGKSRWGCFVVLRTHSTLTDGQLVVGVLIN